MIKRINDFIDKYFKKEEKRTKDRAKKSIEKEWEYQNIKEEFNQTMDKFNKSKTMYRTIPPINFNIDISDNKENNKKVLKIKRMEDESLYPSYANKYAAGLDIRACKDVLIKSDKAADIETKLSVSIPSGYFGLVVPRSGIAFKHHINLINTVGIIDEDYRGEIGIRLINNGKEDYQVKKGDRVAQLILILYIQGLIQVVDELDETERGSKGFGSSGR